MPYLEYISDEDLEACVDALLVKANQAQSNALKKFNKNVIDPFSPLFEMGGFNVSHDAWVKSELTRQAQKTVSNSIGVFHQSVLGCVKNWEDLGTGGQVDLVCEKEKIIAEVKNKHNTVKGSDLKNVYYEMDDLISRKASNYKGYTAYFVSIIPAKPEKYDLCFTPSDKERGSPCPTNEYIRKIDGYSFYDMVTGSERALPKLFNALPEVIRDRTKKLKLDFIKYDSEEIESLNKYFELAYGSAN